MQDLAVCPDLSGSNHLQGHLRGACSQSSMLRKHHCQLHQGQLARYRIPTDYVARVKKTICSRSYGEDIRDFVAGVESYGLSGGHFEVCVCLERCGRGMIDRWEY